MKKIMFNDKYGLTKAVLEGRKTQTRRLILSKTIEKAEQYRVDYFNNTLDNISLEDMLIYLRCEIKDLIKTLKED